MSGNRKKAAMYAAAAGCMWGTIGLFVNVVSGYGIRSLELTVSRMVIAAAILGICFLIRGRNLFRVRAGGPYMVGGGGNPVFAVF